MFAGLDTSGIWRVLKGNFSSDNASLSDFEVNDINNYFVNSSTSDSVGYPDLDMFDDDISSFAFRCISDDELFAALCKVKSKSVGVDGISIRFLRIIFPYVSHLLVHHVNSILTYSIFPIAWKTARVVPIPKSRIVHGLDDLRPISILPALSKVVEHILSDQMQSFVCRDIISSQYAFRRGHSTTSLLLNLTDNIRCNINERKISALISLDLTKAFNSINFLTLINKLRVKFNFSRSACKLIFSYVSERYQFVELEGVHSDILPLFSGVPQGSVLGPLLFILYMNDLTEHIDASLCRTFLFADDIFLLFSSYRDNVDVLEANVNYNLERFEQWSSANSLRINSA